MSFTETFVKPLALSTIPLFLGSLMFVGVIENYKDESSLKVKLLEDYFKPSRELISACLKSQNELYLQYPMSSASFHLLYDEMAHLIDNPSLESNYDYGVILKSVMETYFKSNDKLKSLEKNVEDCQTKVFQSLEVLSLATGTFDKFTVLSKNRANSLNLAYKTRSDKGKLNVTDIDSTDMQTMMRSLASKEFSSAKGKQKLKQNMQNMLPIIDKYSEIMSETGIQIYKIESDFYFKVKDEASIQISNKFKGGFLTWLF